jgi:hypothetical protein
MSWWEQGETLPTPDGAVAAIRSARDKMRRGEPLGFNMADRIAAAKARLQEAMSGTWHSRQAILPRLAVGQAAPQIDGVLDDPMWKVVPSLGPFVPFKVSAADQARVPTSAKVTCDEEHLYIAFRCMEPVPENLRSVGEKKDDDIWRGDCVEVFLGAVDGTSPFHFIVNPANLQWDGKDGPEDWDGEWQSGTWVGADDWTVEMAVPWSAIGARPDAGTRLRANLCRHRAATDEHTTWSPVFRSNLEPEHLGTWVLGE